MLEILDKDCFIHIRNKYIIEASFERCENLMYGRMSFQGFNQDVEVSYCATSFKIVSTVCS